MVGLCFGVSEGKPVVAQAGVQALASRSDRCRSSQAMVGHEKCIGVLCTVKIELETCLQVLPSHRPHSDTASISPGGTSGPVGASASRQVRLYGIKAVRTSTRVTNGVPETRQESFKHYYLSSCHS